MQQQNGHENLLRPNTRNQRQQIESGRDVKDCRIGKKVEHNNAIKNRWHASLSTSKKNFASGISAAPLSHRFSLNSQPSTLNFLVQRQAVRCAAWNEASGTLAVKRKPTVLM